MYVVLIFFCCCTSRAFVSVNIAIKYTVFVNYNATFCSVRELFVRCSKRCNNLIVGFTDIGFFIFFILKAQNTHIIKRYIPYLLMIWVVSQRDISSINNKKNSHILIGAVFLFWYKLFIFFLSNVYSFDLSVFCNLILMKRHKALPNLRNYNNNPQGKHRLLRITSFQYWVINF